MDCSSLETCLKCFKCSVCNIAIAELLLCQFLKVVLSTIDGAKDDGSVGRMINDNHKSPNCKIKKLAVDGMPHLCLFALRDILPGEEITYSYGDGPWPWRKQVSEEMLQNCSESSDSSMNHSDDDYIPKSSEESSPDCSSRKRVKRTMWKEEERRAVENIWPNL
ncbi:KT5AB methyltransferase, partial [Polypterus senegalus]